MQALLFGKKTYARLALLSRLFFTFLLGRTIQPIRLVGGKTGGGVLWVTKPGRGTRLVTGRPPSRFRASALRAPWPRPGCRRRILSRQGAEAERACGVNRDSFPHRRSRGIVPSESKGGSRRDSGFLLTVTKPSRDACALPGRRGRHLCPVTPAE